LVWSPVYLRPKFIVYFLFIVILSLLLFLRARVQPTLDPYAEAFL